MAKNPNPRPMTDATNNDSAHNHGFKSSSIGSGQTVISAYGLDRSTEAGSAAAEQATMRGMGGSTTNLSHSLKGVSANQKGS